MTNDIAEKEVTKTLESKTKDWRQLLKQFEYNYESMDLEEFIECDTNEPTGERLTATDCVQLAEVS